MAEMIVHSVTGVKTEAVDSLPRRCRLIPPLPLVEKLECGDEFRFRHLRAPSNIELAGQSVELLSTQPRQCVFDRLREVDRRFVAPIRVGQRVRGHDSDATHDARPSACMVDER